MYVQLVYGTLIALIKCTSTVHCMGTVARYRQSVIVLWEGT